MTCRHTYVRTYVRAQSALMSPSSLTVFCSTYTAARVYPTERDGMRSPLLYIVIAVHTYVRSGSGQSDRARMRRTSTSARTLHWVHVRTYVRTHCRICGTNYVRTYRNQFLSRLGGGLKPLQVTYVTCVQILT